jgi:hypothetical protein
MSVALGCHTGLCLERTGFSHPPGAACSLPAVLSTLNCVSLLMAADMSAANSATALDESAVRQLAARHVFGCSAMHMVHSCHVNVGCISLKFEYFYFCLPHCDLTAAPCMVLHLPPHLLSGKYEGPYDVLHWALKALGDEAGAAAAQQEEQKALAARNAPGAK